MNGWPMDWTRRLRDSQREKNGDIRNQLAIMSLSRGNKTQRTKNSTSTNIKRYQGLHANELPPVMPVYAFVESSFCAHDHNWIRVNHSSLWQAIHEAFGHMLPSLHETN
jgi:hypothetical protein